MYEIISESLIPCFSTISLNWPQVILGHVSFGCRMTGWSGDHLRNRFLQSFNTRYICKRKPRVPCLCQTGPHRQGFMYIFTKPQFWNSIRSCAVKSPTFVTAWPYLRYSRKSEVRSFMPCDPMTAISWNSVPG